MTITLNHTIAWPFTEQSTFHANLPERTNLYSYLH